MQAKETKFSYVYQSLKTRIVSGQLQQGRSLPSGRRLCQEYQVGIRTVTEVLKALQEEGLIEIQPRRAPRVCGPGAGQEPSAAALAVLAHRDGLMQMYRTMALLLPAMLTVSAKDCLFGRSSLARLTPPFLLNLDVSHYIGWKGVLQVEKVKIAKKGERGATEGVEAGPVLW